ncbi:alpha-L-fucosidase [Echinicola marina]|uniref:alpha-L-fucosidase n=1 Tax=Echinicola marina TaxID=2859768 RepID=UPI001CF6B367|nr:alpha-L-fucosidase [Echinicola marina]UCS93372.1 alpha-L-fucosidase [Echinicola marina]
MNKMNFVWQIIFGVILLLVAPFDMNAQILKPANEPNQAQKEMIKRGYGMFIHFGINTFADIEWSDGSIPVEQYQPTDLDPDQWVRVARDAGFRYVSLITKHHDGFCLWDSKYTDYDVASSPVKMDVVKAVSEACEKYGLEFAVYYSLWDRKEPTFKDENPQKYIDYMKNQLTELFTNYGTIAELWLDGGWRRDPKDCGLDQLYALVKGFNPNCAFSVNHTILNEAGKRKFTLPSTMTEDNKYYFQYFPSDFRLWDPKLITRYDKKQYLHEGKSYYLPFEHTICISSRWNWFQKSKHLPVRSLDELEELFYWSTDNDNCLVINVPPDQTGKIREYEANAVMKLGERLGIEKDKPLPKNGEFISAKMPVSASSTLREKGKEYTASAVTDGSLDSRWSAADTLSFLEIQLDPENKFNKISIFEYQDSEQLDDGFSNIRTNRIKEYNIQVLTDGKCKTIYVGSESMGDCKVIRFPVYYQGTKLKLNITKAQGLPSINEINIIDMSASKKG